MTPWKFISALLKSKLCRVYGTSDILDLNGNVSVSILCLFPRHLRNDVLLENPVHCMKYRVLLVSFMDQTKKKELKRTNLFHSY